MAPERFSGATHKETPCFAAERGPDPFGHTRALRGPFFDSKSQGQGLGLKGRHFSGATHKEQPCFAAERGPDSLEHSWVPHGLVGPHTKNRPVLLQNAVPTPLGTHEHSKVYFLMLSPRDRV